MSSNNRRAAILYGMTLCLITTSSSVWSQVLTEYQLSAAAQPTDIDATVGDTYFLDPGTQSVNRLSGGTLTQWFNLPCFLTPIDKIAVSTAIFPVGVYFTSISASQICILDATNNVVFWWTLPPIVGSPRTLSVDPTGVAWYSSTPPSGPPAIGALDPIASLVKLWLLPPGIAIPPDVIDGLVFANNQVYLTVAGSQSTICVMNPAPNPSPTFCYPIPINFPAPLRVNSSGDVYRIAGLAIPQIFRLRPAPSTLTTWFTPNPPDLFLSQVDPPYFTALSLDVDALDPTVPGSDTFVPPSFFNVFSDYGGTFSNGLMPPHADSTPGTSLVPLSSASIGAFTVWSSTSSSGPVSTDPSGAVWISETPASKIATFHP